MSISSWPFALIIDAPLECQKKGFRARDHPPPETPLKKRSGHGESQAVSLSYRGLQVQLGERDLQCFFSDELEVAKAQMTTGMGWHCKSRTEENYGVKGLKM